ncbi:MAG: 2-phospho-L-lactate transferase CofD family protein [Parvibaculaceae bacterium]
MPKHIVIFSGGTAQRQITIALARRGLAVTRIVPAWDSGGSSRAIRQALGIIPVGDIRQALMTLAYAEGRAGEAVRIFNARLSDTDDARQLAREFVFYRDGQHPAFAAMDGELCTAILKHLARFAEAVDGNFDLRRGSIGNFVLTGAYLANGRDINRAIEEFRALCRIAGNVWPSSPGDDLTLTATLKDGRTVREQHRITALRSEDARTGIADVTLEGRAVANAAALAAIAEAEAIVFGPGSFFTSVLPHLKVGGIGEAIAKRDVPRLFIGNMLEDQETLGLSIAGMVASLERSGFSPSHILAHRPAMPFALSEGGRRFIAADPENLWRNRERGTLDVSGGTFLAGDFEDPGSRGSHDAERMARIIAELAGA